MYVKITIQWTKLLLEQYFTLQYILTLELSPLVTESPTVEPLPELTAREELHEERSKKEVTIDDQTVTLDMNIINEYKAVYSHGGMYTFTCINIAFL